MLKIIDLHVCFFAQEKPTINVVHEAVAAFKAAVLKTAGEKEEAVKYKVSEGSGTRGSQTKCRQGHFFIWPTSTSQPMLANQLATT